MLEQETTALDEAFHAAENALSAANEAVKAAAQQMFAAKEAKNALGTAPEKGLPQSKAELDAKSTETQTLSVQLGRFGSDLRTITESTAAVQQYTEEAAALDVQYSRAAKLAGYVTGRSNALRVPLLQYVLGMMLDETIQSANRFFSVLSRGRYALQHKQGKSGAGYGGLDIEVLDGMSGTCRSVETLSGGEQFLASLSLAFGLSDVVQSYSGAVRLDSIFIDEGFGSLGYRHARYRHACAREHPPKRARRRYHLSRFGTAKPHPDDDPHWENRFGLRRSKSHRGRLNRF